MTLTVEWIRGYLDGDKYATHRWHFLREALKEGDNVEPNIGLCFNILRPEGYKNLPIQWGGEPPFHGKVSHNRPIYYLFELEFKEDKITFRLDGFWDALREEGDFDDIKDMYPVKKVEKTVVQWETIG